MDVHPSLPGPVHGTRPSPRVKALLALTLFVLAVALVVGLVVVSDVLLGVLVELALLFSGLVAILMPSFVFGLMLLLALGFLL